MRDYNKPVRTGYFQRLNGAILYGASVVPVYSKQAPNNASYPYIILSTQTGVDDFTKNNQGQEVTILIQIITGFMGAIKDEIADEIADQIYQLIHPADKNFIDVGPGFQVVSTTLLLDTCDENQNDTFKIYRRLIRFGHRIRENIFN